ncbi:Putative uncharacterized protein [Lactobacillus equicursoris DSM 19284 = JCM 14600 = CIP 110162]|uniref:Bacteriophage abortive infection AbiH n=1 Tax=Lactobacillus equicursoris DSM 19284 = JCM 14600 = CIP 110162 TaxID=1293597 RepID=K0NSB4_9LACO|nr:AbiH family protein [Lactobacillus equicursoris]KRL02736.1 hypothetical protein FC20_GL000131 [Lactobacillus equicursoris DSM 19284 = JCM 14600 = CIP 110162]CCK85064.1 Putative uncharacterized protein [Lactobacillus equicursoris DSM 19284 = JCM 14600 = CIP 110162]
MKQLIVLGNGFDLACGLKSNYSDFFLNRFQELFCDSNNQEFNNLNKMSNILNKKRNEIYVKLKGTDEYSAYVKDKLPESDKFKAYSKEWSKNTTLNRWDIIFLFAQICVGKDVKSYEWQDVETIILEVLSILFVPRSKIKSNVQYSDDIGIQFGHNSGRSLFREVVNKISFVGEGDKNEIATEMLTELNKFEFVFGEFISKQFDQTVSEDSYIRKAIDLLKEISIHPQNTVTTEEMENDEIDVLSFNYSLDEVFKDMWDKFIGDYSLKTWTNIHGLSNNLPDPNFASPIFGIDSHNISDEDDLRIAFTKSYRVVEENVNAIRSSAGYKNRNVITIYGHSLSKADYSYFEALFDENDLYHSRCKVEYYYKPGKTDVESFSERKGATTRLYKLLSDYGSTLDNSHGENLIYKMNLENRLSVIPGPKI